MERKDFPILEFDGISRAKIEPSEQFENIGAPKFCVITYFAEVIEKMKNEGRLKKIAALYTASGETPVYETEHKGVRTGIVQGLVGAPAAAGLIEELIPLGFSKFMVCGGAGVLQKGIQVGHLVLPVFAVRDEGTSYHYAEPSREIEMDSHAVQVIERVLSEKDIPFIRAKTWTTDALYRETEDKIALRVSEGCVTVEMEGVAPLQFRWLFLRGRFHLRLGTVNTFCIASEVNGGLFCGFPFQGRFPRADTLRRRRPERQKMGLKELGKQRGHKKKSYRYMHGDMHTDVKDRVIRGSFG